MRYVVVLLALPLILGVGPCRQGPPPSGGAPMQAARPTADTVAVSLRGAGLQVKAADTISQPFFSAPGRVLVVEGDDLQVYEYPSTDAAAADAAKISPSGSPIGMSMPNWMRPPHIYRKENLILIYLGNSPRVRASLQAQMGPQIAGGR